MVPVPEELAEQVVEYVRWVSTLPDRKGAAPQARLARQAQRVRARPDDPLATAVLDRRQITVFDMVRLSGLDARQIAGIAFELNQVLAAQAGIQLALLIKPPEDVGTGPLDWGQQVMVMRAQVAQAILAAARAHGEA
jgi:hypothetical protein